MKRTRKALVWLIVLLTMLWTGFPSAAAQESYGVFGDFVFEAIGMEVRLVEYHGNDSFVVIPSEIDGARVTVLGRRLFYSNDFLQGVMLPETLEMIEDECFADCLNLTEILLPPSIRFIGLLAFYDCQSLSYIDFPGPIDYIGRGPCLIRLGSAGTRTGTIS